MSSLTVAPAPPSDVASSNILSLFPRPPPALAVGGDLGEKDGGGPRGGASLPVLAAALPLGLGLVLGVAGGVDLEPNPIALESADESI